VGPQQLWKKHLQRNDPEGVSFLEVMFGATWEKADRWQPNGDEELPGSDSLSLARHRRQERRETNSKAITRGLLFHVRNT